MREIIIREIGILKWGRAVSNRKRIRNILTSGPSDRPHTADVLRCMERWDFSFIGSKIPLVFLGRPWGRFIILMSCRQHGSSWLSLATLLYRPSLPARLQGYILNWYRPVVYRFLLVKGSTGVRHSQVRPHIWSVPHVWFVMDGRTAAVLWGAASMICSILLAAFLRNCHKAFSPYV